MGTHRRAQKVTKAGILYTYQTQRSNKFKEALFKTKKFQFRVLISEVKSLVCTVFSPEFPVYGDKECLLYPPGTGKVTFHIGDLFPAFKWTNEGQSVLLASAVS